MKTCYKCGKTLGVMSTKFVCRNCGKTFCSQCMIKIDIPAEIASLFNLTNEFTKPEWSLRKMSYVYCPVCAAKFNDSKNRLFLANSHLDDIELVSINYKGYKPYDKTSARKIESNFNKDRNDSERELKAIAKYYGRDMIINVKTTSIKKESETDSGGTYIYRVWKYEGDAVNRYTKK